MGWVMREWREEVLLGIMSEWSASPLVAVEGRSCCVEAGLSRVVGRKARSRREGAMVNSIFEAHSTCCTRQYR